MNVYLCSCLLKKIIFFLYISAELKTKPTDMNTRIKLLKLYAESGRVELALNHAFEVEARQSHSSLMWYRCINDICKVKYFFFCKVLLFLCSKLQCYLLIAFLLFIFLCYFSVIFFLFMFSYYNIDHLWSKINTGILEDLKTIFLF